MIRAAIIGLGDISFVHLDGILGNPEIQLVAACDLNEELKSRVPEGTPFYTDYKQMVAEQKPDVVHNCLPHYLHFPVTRELVEMGCNVFCEKPIALNYRDAKEMLDTAEAKGCNLYIAQVLQFTKEIQALHKLVETEEYGKVLDASFERLSAAPRWAVGGWLFDKDKSGLLPFDLHIHDLDVIVSLFGKPDSFTATTCRGRDKTYPEHLRINYRFGDVNVLGEAAWYNADIPWTARWSVYFENAVVIHDGASMTAYRFDETPRVFDIKDEVEISTGINVPPCGWYYNELKHFAECIRDGKPTPNVTREQLLAVMEILEEVSK